MAPVELYQPGKVNVVVNFPTAWNELHGDEVVEICKQLLLLADKKDVAKAAIFHYIVQRRAKIEGQKLPSGWVNLMDAEQVAMQAFPVLDFIYEQNDLIGAPERRIKLPGFFSPAVYGPEKGFESLTCGEFEEAERFFNRFVNKPDQDSLALLAGVLWRPNKWRKRVPLHREARHILHTYNHNLFFHQFMRLEPWRLYAIFTWYTGSRSMLPKMFPTVYEKNKDEKATPEKPDILAFTRCIHAGAGPKNGTRNVIRQMRLFEFMFDMEQDAKAAKAMTN